MAFVKRVVFGGPYLACLLVSIFLSSCGGSTKDRIIEPVQAGPLSARALWLVVSSPYAQIVDSPKQDAVVLDHRRRGDVDHAVKRLVTPEGGHGVHWLQLDAGGWIRESDVVVYDSEGKARTAVKEMAK